MDVVLQVLMWLGLAFLAGFVGQFGKSLTLKLLARRRAASGAAPAPDYERSKLEKKRAKAELKRSKKSHADEETS